MVGERGSPQMTTPLGPTSRQGLRLGPLMDQLQSQRGTSRHGDSVGDTNPSLLRPSVQATTPIAYVMSYNREGLGDDGKYFHMPDDLGPIPFS